MTEVNCPYAKAGCPFQVCATYYKYMLFVGWEVRIVKSPKSQFFTIRTDPKPVNNLFIFFQALKRKRKTHGKNSRKRYCDRGQ